MWYSKNVLPFARAMMRTTIREQHTFSAAQKRTSATHQITLRILARFLSLLSFSRERVTFLQPTNSVLLFEELGEK